MAKSLLQERSDELRKLTECREQLINEFNEIADKANELKNALHKIEQERIRGLAALDCVDAQIETVKGSIRSLLDAS
jgi:predicted nuclease with TOPRIM domain